MEALGFCQGGIQTENQDGTQTVHDLSGLFNEDPETYYAMVIDRANEMIGKYKALYDACGSRNAPKASLVYDYLGESFDDSSYQKVKQELIRKASVCRKVRDLYAKRIKGVSK